MTRVRNEWGILVGHTVKAMPLDISVTRVSIEDRRVALTQVAPGVKVSTVFLELDHGFGDKPLWFESMCFGGPLAYECERYETWDEAEAGHGAMVERVKDAIAAEMEASCPS